MITDVKSLVDGVLSGEPRSLARAISVIENHMPGWEQCLEQMYLHSGRAEILGFTGAPGVGKSTLVNAVMEQLLNMGKKVAVLAIDPSSPFSGGALLGDRIRMSKSMLQKNAFIRSMSTRGAMGGIAASTWDVSYVLDAAGYDVIIIETVGVGQVEVDVMRGVDVCVVVLVPGMGDSIQALKAGIIEIADVFVINKADRDGANALERELNMVLSLADSMPKVEIVKTCATSGQGVADLLRAKDEFRKAAASLGLKQKKRKDFARSVLFQQMSSLILAEIMAIDANDVQIEAGVERIVNERVAPLIVARDLVARYKALCGSSLYNLQKGFL